MHRALTVIVRPATLDDVAAMARLRDASAWDGGAPEPTMRRYLTGDHHPREALAPRAAFVAERHGMLIGYVAGHLTTRFGCAGELQWLLVHPEHRGSGVSTRLVQALAAWFGEQGAARVCVNVAPENERARRFYGRLGAVARSEHWMEWSEISAVTTIASAAASGQGRRAEPGDGARREHDSDNL